MKICKISLSDGSPAMLIKVDEQGFIKQYIGFVTKIDALLKHRIEIEEDETLAVFYGPSKAVTYTKVMKTNDVEKAFEQASWYMV
jgi:hypothetical protein